jgi:hypothetical protein
MKTGESMTTITSAPRPTVAVAERTWAVPAVASASCERIIFVSWICGPKKSNCFLIKIDSIRRALTPTQFRRRHFQKVKFKLSRFRAGILEKFGHYFLPDGEERVVAMSWARLYRVMEFA